ncbi:hypothetical protein AUO94_07375 [Planococcus kocurii]|uniref:DUF4825 domain-containing protein n=1 Tax=Planococcus kocurii TaxID=1374 RepID=A0ABM5WVZ8_9BACL|nr:hypothetical protein [Planococcus kocurii]ALS78490.1 hypothetical protein AUO94_07375 [Planococcus kocurii]
MNKWFAFLLLSSVLLLSACSDTNDLVGKTFDVAYVPVLEEDTDSPDRYSSILTLEFLNENTITSPVYGEGTYELTDDNLVLYYENENESLEITIGVAESDKDFSEYYALINDLDYQITDSDKISHFQNLAFKLDKERPIEFIKD